MSNQGWIGVDLDGTLAHYDHWRGYEHIGEPIPVMVERVQRWLHEGRDVRIVTARMTDRNNDLWKLKKSKAAIEAWCEQHIGWVLPVTASKDYAMLELWDDRAVQVIPNTGQPVGYSLRGL